LIASVAEPNGNGDSKTLALALAKRPGSILKAMKDQSLDLPKWWEDAEDEDEGDDNARGNIGQDIAREKGGSGIMQPPPLDPLHNLEIVVGGTYTVGRLISVPSRRFGDRSSGNEAKLLDYEQRGEVVDAEEGPGYFKYQLEDEQVTDAEIPSMSSNVDPKSELLAEVVDEEVEEDDDDEITDELLAKAEEEAAKAAAVAETAAAEAKRKEEKMKLCKYPCEIVKSFSSANY